MFYTRPVTKEAYGYGPVKEVEQETRTRTRGRILRLDLVLQLIRRNIYFEELCYRTPPTSPITILKKNRKLAIRYRSFLKNLSWSRMLKASHGTIDDRYKDIIVYFSRQSAMLHIYL